MKYSLPPFKRLVMTLTAKDNGGLLTLLHCPEDLRNMLKSTGKKSQEQKYHLANQSSKGYPENWPILVRYQNVHVKYSLGQTSYAKGFAHRMFASGKWSKEKHVQFIQTYDKRLASPGMVVQILFSEPFMILKWDKDYLLKWHLSSAIDINRKHHDWANNGKKRDSGILFLPLPLIDSVPLSKSFHLSAKWG